MKLILKLLFKDLKNLSFYLERLNFKSFILLLRHPKKIRRCIVRLNATFKNKNNKLIMHLNSHNVSFYINSMEDISMILEIFFETTYAFNTNEDFSVIDIGMNVGITSLFFANLPNVKQVYSFEPFADTYNHGLYNFALNSEFSKKIHPHNYGLSNKNEIINIPYSYKFRGNMTSSKENIKNIGINSKNWQQKTIELKSVNEEFSKIFDACLGDRILLKIDCEGAEYEILEALDQSGLIKKVDYIIMEWHFKG